MLGKIFSEDDTPTVRTYQKLMQVYAHDGDAEEIRNLIEQQQLTVDRFMLSHLITAYLVRYVHILLYSRKYWWELNLAIEFQITITNTLAGFKFGGLVQDRDN